MPGKDSSGCLVCFALSDNLHPGSLEPEIDSADS
jgi:hypothetical protein